MHRLAGKVAIVTGAGNGIGRSTAFAMAAEGAAVLVADQNAETGSKVAAQIVERGGQGAFQLTDVGNSEDVRQMVAAAVDRWGRLNILVNNVGVAIPEMLKQGGGSIVSLSSIQSLQGFHNWSGYAASKGGINALTQQAAIEYAPQNVCINAIAPGTILTAMNEALWKDAPDRVKLLQEVNAAHPLGRAGWPEEVATLAVFLAAEEATFITGQVLVIDGGHARIHDRARLRPMLGHAQPRHDAGGPSSPQPRILCVRQW